MMKYKLNWNQRRGPSRLVPAEEKAPYIEKIEALHLDPHSIGSISIENIDKILTTLEEYYAQFGIVQICLEMSGYGEAKRVADIYEIDIEVECQEELSVKTEHCIYHNGLMQSTTIYRSDTYDRDPDNYKKAAEFGRQVYYALREKHPLLTRDLGEPYGANERAPKYEVVCEKCGFVRQRRRKCRLTEHPELFRCSCGGKLKLKNNG